MKKSVGIATGVVVIAVAGWLGTTWYTGKRIEAEEPAKLAELNEQLATSLVNTGIRFTASRASYERHFFSTDAHYNITLALAGDTEPDDVTIDVAVKIEHGPFAKSALASGNFMPNMAFVHAELAPNKFSQPLFDLTKGVPAISSNTLFSYSGNNNSTVNVIPFELAEDGDVVKFGGLELKGTYKKDNKQTIASGTMGDITVDVTDDGQHVKATISGTSMDLDSTIGKFGFGLGTSKVNVGHILLDVQPVEGESPEVVKKVELKDFAYNTLVAEEGDNARVEAKYSLGQLLINDASFGKGHATIKLDNLDGQAIQTLLKFYNDALKEMTTGGKSPTSGAVAMDLLNQALKMLAANPSMRIDPLVWETPKGQSTLDLNIGLTKPKSLNVGLQQLENGDPKALLMEALKLIDLNVKLSTPMVEELITLAMQMEGMDAAQAASEAAEQASMMSSMAEMFGVAKLNGDNLESNFHYADGVMTLNGQEVPPEMLFGALGQ